MAGRYDASPPRMPASGTSVAGTAVYALKALRYGYQLYPGPAVLWFSNWFEWIRLDLFLWLVQGEGRTVLVDTGMSQDHADAVNDEIRRAMGPQAGIVVTQDPLELLDEEGVNAEDVDTVILSHAHIDHISNVAKFPRAEFVFSSVGWDWHVNCDLPELRSSLAVPAHALRFLEEEAAPSGRLRLTADDAEVLPGITTHRTGGHTIDHQSVLIQTAHGKVGLAVDNGPLFRNIDSNTPVGSPFDVVAALRALVNLKKEADLVIPSHDPEVMVRFPDGKIA